MEERYTPFFQRDGQTAEEQKIAPFPGRHRNPAKEVWALAGVGLFAIWSVMAHRTGQPMWAQFHLCGLIVSALLFFRAQDGVE